VLGVVSTDQLDAAYAPVAFAAPPGGVFGPVRTQYGWNVGKVIQVMPPAPAVFDQVKDSLRQQLQLDRQLTTWRDWMAGAIRKAHVRYADGYRPADPDSPPQVNDAASASVPAQQPTAPPSAGGR
ncbi:peptidyl-prolyl cis-trans isomerase, partial [Frankia sp. CiP1_Cm_nod2]